MNNGLMTERAHLGVFSTSSYITIGDTYGGKKTEGRPRGGCRRGVVVVAARGLRRQTPQIASSWIGVNGRRSQGSFLAGPVPVEIKFS